MSASVYTLPAGNVQLAISGGRTSAYMLRRILEVNGDLPNRVVATFENTGREMPQTLDFVAELSHRWQVPITWLEYLPDAPGYLVVDHYTAARDGQPFEALIRKRKFLPNQQARFCTVELKVRPAKKWVMAQGWERWTNAAGLRADEPHRLNKPPPCDRWTVWTPLADAGVTKEHVSKFWKAQAFDLMLPNNNGNTPLGNCDGCFLKAEAINAHLAAEYPERAAWWERMEDLASSLTSGTGGTFSSRFSRRDLRDFVSRQGSLLPGVLCQQDGGECFA